MRSFDKFISILKKIFHPEKVIENQIDMQLYPYKVESKETEPSPMQSWAEREIEIACKRERAASEEKEGCWDYGCACYESALKAFRSLQSDEHSGMSIGFTKDILNRLIDHKPLTAIEDTPDVWSDVLDRSGHRGEDVCYQNKRMSSLFKYVYADGTVKYRDVDAFVGVDIENDFCFHSGLIDNIMNELNPIIMPYYPPSKPTRVYITDALTDRKNGDFDTRAIRHAVMQNGDRIEINRYFKEPETDKADGWEEIDEVEFNQRLDMDRKRRLKESEEGRE